MSMAGNSNNKTSWGLEAAVLYCQEELWVPLLCGLLELTQGLRAGPDPWKCMLCVLLKNLRKGSSFQFQNFIFIWVLSLWPAMGISVQLVVVKSLSRE